MIWQIPVFTRCVVAYIAHPIVSKKLADLPGSRTRRIRLTVLFCFLMALAYVAFRPTHVSWKPALILFTFGIANSFAIYAQWRAQAISMSRYGMFTMLDDVIPIALGIVLLGEHKVITPTFGVGLALSLSAAFAYSIIGTRNSAPGDRNRFSIFLWIGIYSLVWGLANFFFRVLGLEEFPTSMFAVCWYGGSLIGSNMLVWLMRGREEAGSAMTPKGVFQIFLLSFFTITSILLEYVSSQYAELVVTQPIFLVAEMVLTTLVGLVVFRERKQLTLGTKVTLLCALLGCALILFGYRAPM